MNDFGNLNVNNGDEIDLNDKVAVADSIVRVTRFRLGCQFCFTTAVSQAEKVITAATGPPVRQSQYMVDRLEGSLDNLNQQYAQLNATNQQLLLLDATPGHQMDWEEAIYDTNSLYTDIQNRIDMAIVAVTVPVANTLKHPPKAKSPIAPTPSIHKFELYHTLFPQTKPVNLFSHKYYGVSESVISKMIHWAQLAKSRISMSHQSTLTCFDGSTDNFSLTKFENLAPQQDVVSKLVNPVVVLESQIGINEERSKISIEVDDESGKNYFILKLFATILVSLLCFVGGLVAVWNVLKSDEPIIHCLTDTIGDGVCDDKQNIVECRYDGMDCCVRTSDRSICEVCECHLWKGQEDTTTTTTITTGITTGSTDSTTEQTDPMLQNSSDLGKSFWVLWFQNVTFHVGKWRYLALK
jgi:hypothetical protein